MHNSIKLIILIAVITSFPACSVYNTNAKDIEFDSARAENIKPEIYVGELDEQANDFTYLGWVEAKVFKANPFSEKPTEHMADIVLAHKARKMGAHAVTYVSYKTNSIGAMVAKGQAVRINEIDDKEILVEQRQDKLKKQEQIKELLYGNSQAAPGLEDIPVTSTTTGTVLPEEFTGGLPEVKKGSVEDIKKNLVANSPKIEESALAQGDVEVMLLKLKTLREKAGSERDFEMYQGITEVIELLREYQKK